MANLPYETLQLSTPTGIAAARLYSADHPQAGVVCVGGVGGGWDSPARDLYPRLLQDLAGQGVMGLRIRYRNPTDLVMAEEDVLAGITALTERGAERIGLIGHSFGGAVVARAALASPAVTAVVTLATQSSGTEPVRHLNPNVALLALHGSRDDILPASCSASIVKEASAMRKELRIIEGAGHGLHEAAEEVYSSVWDWLLENLTPRKRSTKL